MTAIFRSFLPVCGALVLSLTLSFTLGGCSSWLGDDEPDPLPGERLSVMQMQGHLEAADSSLPSQEFVAPAAWTNEFWPQAGGYSNHVMQHLDLSSGPLEKLWSADIGAGSSKSVPLTAQPVLADGRIYTLDTDSELSAFDAETGKRLWRVYAGSEEEDETVLGGGLAFSSGMLFVTNGYAELLALKPDDGQVFWRIKLPAPARAAPTVLDGRVFALTMDQRLSAFDLKDGKLLWDYQGIAEGAGLLGAASAAANREIVVAPFSSGEIFAIRVENGSVAWGDNLAPPLRIGGVGGLSDIRALPVIDKGLVIAVSYGGRIVAIDERTGQRVWQRDFGGLETPWIVGTHVFALSSENQLVALSRDTGAIGWVLPLDRFEDEKNREGPIVWTGPVLAGGRLILTGTDGRLVEVKPEDGTVLRRSELSDTPAVPMLVANKTLYILTKDGTLSAWR